VNNVKSYIIVENPEVHDIEILNESAAQNGKPKLVFRAILQEADVTNVNRRIYPKSVLQEIAQKLYDKAINRELVGEFGHPFLETDNYEILKKRTIVIDPNNICVLYRNIEFDGRYIIAECETLTTNKGLDLYQLIKDNVNIGFSLRALGSVTEVSNDGVVKVSNGITPITYDVVIGPSHKSARLIEFLEEDIRNLSLDVNTTILNESVGTDSIENSRKHFFIPIGYLKFDNNTSEELKNVLKEDGINVDKISVYIDTSNNVARICHNNVCVQKTIEDFVDTLINNRYQQIDVPEYSIDGLNTYSDECEYYPLVGLSKSLKLFSIISPDEYKPFINITPTDILATQLSKDQIEDFENTEKELIGVNEQNFYEIVSKFINEEFAENIDELDKILKLPERVLDEYIIVTYKALDENPINYYLVDFMEYEDLSNITLTEYEQSILEAIDILNNTDDYIDLDNYEYSKQSSLELVYEEILDEVNEILKQENKDNVIENYKDIFDEAVIELKSMPSLLKDMYLESINMENNAKDDLSYNALLKLVDVDKINTILEYLIEEQYKEHMNDIQDVIVDADIYNDEKTMKLFKNTMDIEFLSEVME